MSQFCQIVVMMAAKAILLLLEACHLRLLLVGTLVIYCIYDWTTTVFIAGVARQRPMSGVSISVQLAKAASPIRLLCEQ